MSAWLPPPRAFVESDAAPEASDAVPRLVAPGDSAVFLAGFEAPETAGDYVVEWDMVCEFECWFAECGSTVLRKELTVRPGDPPSG